MRYFRAKDGVTKFDLVYLKSESYGYIYSSYNNYKKYKFWILGSPHDDDLFDAPTHIPSSE